MTYTAEPVGPADGAVPARPVLADVRAALSIAVALAVISALLGIVWALWSPPGPRALVLGPGLIQADETEAFIAGDGRFLVLSAAVGVLAGLLAWRRRANRGPLVLGALAAGGLVGSLLMELVGHLSGGGTSSGRTNTIIDRLPLSLHIQGLVFVEAGVAVLVYGMLVAFTSRDDLGRPDPVRDEVARSRVPSPMGVPGPYPPPYPYPAQLSYGSPDGSPAGRPRPSPSVRPGDQPQDGGGDGDAPGVLQQRDLPPQ